MQAASEAYKSVMKEKWRNQRSFMRITIGVINQEAQETAEAQEIGQTAYTYYSNLSAPFDGLKVEERYASCEQNYTAVDGSFYFLPRNSADVILNQGIVTEELFGSIEIRFPYAMDIRGLTIDFGMVYPMDFIILSDETSVTVTGNTNSHFVTREIFSGATFLRFVPSRMSSGQSRLHMEQITIGSGLTFDGEKILSTTKKEYVSPIAEELPSLDFTASIENKDRLFDVENSESVLNFLEIGQKVDIIYGQELPDKSIEWMPGASLILRSWSADDEEMSFSASDWLEDMNGTYYRGRFRQEGISLYDLAVDVLMDAGVSEEDYWIDTYLKSVLVQNPLPPVLHREALQIIANAGRCVLYQDRTGKLFLKSNFLPKMDASSDNAAYFAHPDRITDGKSKTGYSLAGLDYSDTTPAVYFLPREGKEEYLNTGYISEQTADQYGNFSVNPTVTLEAEAAFKCFGLTLEFGGHPPKELILHTYLDGSLQEDYLVTEVTQITVISHEFMEFDRMVIEVTKHYPAMIWFTDETGNYLTDGDGIYLVDDTGTNADSAPGWRVVLDRVVFGDRTDYHLEYGIELTKTPKGTQMTKVKELQVIRTLYAEGTEEKELLKETISEDGRYRFYFSSPVHGISCSLAEAAGAQIEIHGQSSYYAEVNITGLSTATELIISGREYQTTQAKTVRGMNPSGTVETWENPLVSSEDHAEKLAMWIGDYLASDREYDLQYRGEPRLDANDLAYLENKYIPDMLIRIYEHSLTYNGAFSGTIKAKRSMEGG